MPNIHYGIVANSFYYFSTQSGYGYSTGIIKTSFSSSIALNSYGSVGNYRGLYYDSINSRLIATACITNSVDFLDLNLNLINTVPVQNNPVGVVMYNLKKYVAVYTTNSVVVISNGLI